MTNAPSQTLLDTRLCDLAIDVRVGMVDIAWNAADPNRAPGGIVNGVALKPIAGNLMGLVNPQALAVDAADNVYVTADDSGGGA